MRRNVSFFPIRLDDFDRDFGGAHSPNYWVWAESGGDPHRSIDANSVAQQLL
jgi:hypothetical protein